MIRFIIAVFTSFVLGMHCENKSVEIYFLLLILLLCILDIIIIINNNTRNKN